MMTNRRDPDGDRDIFAGAAFSPIEKRGATVAETIAGFGDNGEGDAYLAELLAEFRRDGRFNPATKRGIGPIAFRQLVAAGMVAA